MVYASFVQCIKKLYYTVYCTEHFQCKRCLPLRCMFSVHSRNMQVGKQTASLFIPPQFHLSKLERIVQSPPCGPHHSISIAIAYWSICPTSIVDTNEVYTHARIKPPSTSVMKSTVAVPGIIVPISCADLLSVVIVTICI